MSKRWRYSLLTLASGAAVFGLVFGLMHGCGSDPRAPALLNEPVYTNMQEGFRFVVPEGWKIQGRAEFPQKVMKEEHMLVEYRQIRDGKTLSLLVSMVDLPRDASFTDYVTQRLYPPSGWKIAPAEKLQLGEAPAERLVMTLRTDKDKEGIVREVVAVRKGERVYFFSGSFPAKDTTGRDEIRKAVASLAWER